MCGHVDSGTIKLLFLVHSGAALPAQPWSDSVQDTKYLLGHKLGLSLENPEQAVW